MSATTTPGKLTTELIQRRDDYRALCSLLGWDFEHNMRGARAVLRGVASKDGVGMADAALGIARKMDAAGHNPTIIFAALVEECGA